VDILKVRSENQLTTTDFFAGQGCDECDRRGYKGRIGIYEILVVDKTIRELINTRSSEEDIHSQAVTNGMTTLVMDGINKISAGITTIEEVIRVTGE
jgi:type II secretory ATPase GspE/PulE/Tfp pilus assembly ATPase PilB-like protein